MAEENEGGEGTEGTEGAEGTEGTEGTGTGEGNQGAGAEGTEKEPTVVEDLKTALREIREESRPAPVPAERTPEQIEASIVAEETRTGMTRQQLRAAATMADNAAIRRTADIGAKLGRMEAKEELGQFAGDLLKEVEAEVMKMEPQFRGNPDVWRNTANFIKGKNLEKIIAKHKTKAEPSTVVGGGGTVQSTRGAGPAGGAGKGKQYNSEEQEMITRYFAGDAKAYEATKNRKSVTDDNRVKSPAGTQVGVADAALARMTEGNS